MLAVSAFVASAGEVDARIKRFARAVVTQSTPH